MPLRGALCGAEMRIIAFVTGAPALSSILTHLGEPTSPPEVAPAPGPPLWDPAPEPLANWGLPQYRDADPLVIALPHS